MSLKELTIQGMERKLTGDATIRDVENSFREIYDDSYIKELKMKLARADEDIKNGRVMSLEQARETTLRELREEYESRNT